MNKTLPRDPRVVRISSALKADRCRVVGGLLSAWCLFDEQTEDGSLEGYTPELLDELVGFPGLARAMESVGWLEIGEESLAVPRFDEHNGKSAKRRAQDNVRKMSARKADARPVPDPTKSGPEKRREEKSNTKNPLTPKGGTAADFLEDLWKAGPASCRTRSSKKQLKAAWARTQSKPDPAEALRVLKLWAACDQWTRDLGQYAPGIHRWIANRGWESEPEEPEAAPARDVLGARTTRIVKVNGDEAKEPSTMITDEIPF